MIRAQLRINFQTSNLRWLLFFSLVLFLIPSQVFGQTIGDWRAYTSLRTVTDMDAVSENEVWVATSGGLFNLIDGETDEQLTPVDGMVRLESTALAYDEDQNGLWVGYLDGSIQFYSLNNGSFSDYNDIARNEQYGNKQINDFLIEGEILYMATAFGVVLWDTEDRFVVDSYIRFSNDLQGVAVNHLTISDSLIAVAFQNQVAIADKSDDLILQESWTVYNSQNSPIASSATVTDTEFYEGKLYVGTSSGEVFTLENGTWSSPPFTAFTDNAVTTFWQADNVLYGTDGTTLYALSGSTNQLEETALGISDATAGATSGNQTWVGSDLNGVIDAVTGENLTPQGPFLNFFDGLNMDGDVLITATSPNPNKVSSSIRETGFNVFENGTWTSYNLAITPVLADRQARAFYRSAVADDFYAFASWGNGLSILDKESREITLYQQHNSALEGIENAPFFVVIPGIDVDSDNTLWGTAFWNTNEGLFSYDHEAEEITTYSIRNYVSAGDYGFGFHIDPYDQKWIPLASIEQVGQGLLVLNQGDIDDPSDDTFVTLTNDLNQGFLPDLKVNALVNDKRGEVWVGTERGLVRYIFPERITSGNSNDMRAEFIRSVNNDSILFRDANVRALAVDAANQKWMGTADNGVWLLSENGSRVLRHFTTENSPLTTNTITSIAVNEQNGIVYIATADGLLSYAGVTTRAERKMKSLDLYPNPFNYKTHGDETITIEGLSSNTTVRVVTADGFVVNEFTTRGGRVQWRVRNSSGDRLNSGVYFVIAYDENNEEKGIGKLAVIR